MNETLYSVLGALVLLVVQVIASRLGIKLPVIVPPAPKPADPAQPQPGPLPSLPSLPMPDGKGTLLLSLLQLLLRARAGVETLSPEEMETLRLVREMAPPASEVRK